MGTASCSTAGRCCTGVELRTKLNMPSRNICAGGRTARNIATARSSPSAPALKPRVRTREDASAADANGSTARACTDADRSEVLNPEAPTLGCYTEGDALKAPAARDVVTRCDDHRADDAEPGSESSHIGRRSQPANHSPHPVPLTQMARHNTVGLPHGSSIEPGIDSYPRLLLPARALRYDRLLRRVHAHTAMNPIVSTRKSTRNSV
jgi:hypothetical protein